MMPIFFLLVVIFGQTSLIDANCTAAPGILNRNMARLLYSVPDSPANTEPMDIECSAIILNSFWLMSPASCLFDHSNPALYKIKVHSPDGSMDPKSSPLVANKIIRNPSFNNELGAGYDFALINVLTKMTTECSVELHQEQTFDKCYLVKWSHDRGNFIDKPITVEVKPDSCQFAKHIITTEAVSRLVECADETVCKSEAGAVILCNGMTQSDSHNFYLRDISSWADTFCHKNTANLYTKLSPYFQFINKTITL